MTHLISRRVWTLALAAGALGMLGACGSVGFNDDVRREWGGVGFSDEVKREWGGIGFRDDDRREWRHHHRPYHSYDDWNRGYRSSDRRWRPWDPNGRRDWNDRDGRDWDRDGYDQDWR